MKQTAQQILDRTQLEIVRAISKALDITTNARTAPAERAAAADTIKKLDAALGTLE